jgi:DNA-binding response OmpR family regulator
MENVFPPALQLDSAAVKTVLIVEDNAMIADILIEFLHEETTYHVLNAFDALAALNLIRTSPPHLVLLDYCLPDMDGLACLGWLRASPGMEQTPVILMSASPPQSVQARTDLAVLEKPFDLDFLLSLIRGLLFEQ